LFNKFLIIFLLHILTVAFANANSNGVSVSAGIGAIGSELGYGLFLGSPYWNEGRTSIQVGFRGNQLRGIPIGRSTQLSYGYSILDLTTLNRFYSSEVVSVYAGISALVGFPSDISSSITYALKSSIGAEYLPTGSFFTFFSEVGVSWGINASATNLQGSPNYLTGVTFLMGLKKYLY